MGSVGDVSARVGSAGWNARKRITRCKCDSDLAEDAQAQVLPMRDRTKGTCRNPCSRIRYSADPIFSPFVILIFSTVMLVILVVGSIALLTTVGETKLPSTLTLAVGPTKRD
jgi:hypothetical protein